jgi:GH24 family phage-related lysozyme (muramidase)
MVHLLEEEGFVEGNYADDVGIDTQGVGQTAENKGKNFFTETYPKYVARAQKKVKGYESLSPDLQNAVLSAVYRGDLGPKAAKLLGEGKFKAASKEYLNNKEYKKRKKENPEDGVVLRMERNAAKMAEEAENGRSQPKSAPMAGEGAQRPSTIQGNSGGAPMRQDPLRGGHPHPSSLRR